MNRVPGSVPNLGQNRFRHTYGSARFITELTNASIFIVLASSGIELVRTRLAYKAGQVDLVQHYTLLQFYCITIEIFVCSEPQKKKGERRGKDALMGGKGSGSQDRRFKGLASRIK